MTTLFEVRRVLRRKALTDILAGFILWVGFCSLAQSWTLIRAVTQPVGAGLRPLAYSTIARQTPSGGLAPMDWNTLDKVRAGFHMQHSELVAYAPPASFTLYSRQQTWQVNIASTEEGFFGNFTTGLYAGRDLASTWRDLQPEGQLVLSEKLAARIFGSPASALNQNVSISGNTLRVVGIAPHRFNGLWTDTDAWTTPDQISNLNNASFRASATGLAAKVLSSPGIWKVGDRWYLLASSDQHSSTQLAKQLYAALESSKNRPLNLDAVESLSIDPARDLKVRSASTLVSLMAVVLLLAASLNYSSLLLVRSPGQIEEMRLKRILGASAWRILSEAICGPAFVVLASFSVSVFATLLVLRVVSSHEPNLLIASGMRWTASLPVLGWELPIALLLAITVGLAPAVGLLRQSGMPQLGSFTTQTKLSALALDSMVTVEIAACILACVFVGVIGKATYRLSRVQVGFTSNNLFSNEVSLIRKGGGLISFKTSSDERSPMELFVRQVVDQAKQEVPDLQDITAATCTPLGPPMKTVSIERMQSGTDLLRGVSFCAVGPNYFATVENHIFRGSVFANSDFNGDITQVVINRKLADALWPGEDQLHKTIRLTEPASGLQFDTQIIGIVDDMHTGGAGSSSQETVFLPLKGNAFALSFPIWFLARGTYSSHDLGNFVQRQAATTMPDMGIARSFSVSEKIEDSWRAQRMRLYLGVGGAALVALIAYLGLYGVLIQSVNSRRKELALRLCFGASAGHLRRIVFVRAFRSALAATILSFLSGRVFFNLLNASWLGGVAWSWQIASSICLVCSFAAIGIATIPANMAVQISPSKLLRDV